jgi:hypothetical protein
MSSTNTSPFYRRLRTAKQDPGDTQDSLFSLPEDSPPRWADVIPWKGLMVSSVILGGLAAVGWRVWELVVPMLQAPTIPEFAAARIASPIPRPGGDPKAKPEAKTGSQAKVIEPRGLVMRAEPRFDAARLGGIVVGEQVTILGVSADQGWQQVRRNLNGTEGWVKSGNLEVLAGATVPAAVATPPPPSGPQGTTLLGLSFRSEPSSTSTLLGGIPANEVLSLLELSPDGNWQRVRRQNGQEGWIKAGNVRR